IFPGDRVRFRFYYPHSGFEEMIGHFLGFYTLYEGPEGGGDLNLVIRTVKDGRTTVVYKDRNYLEEYEILEPNMKVRDKIRDLEFLEGRGEGERLPDRLRAAVVRLVFPAAGDRELHENGGDRCKDHPDQGEDERGRVPVPVPGAAAEQHVPAEHPRHERNGAREGRGNRHHEDVAVPDVRDFVGQDASELAFRVAAEDALWHGDDR